MSLVDFYRLLESLALPVAYHHFKEGHSPRLPYLVYLVEQSSNHGADNKAYQKVLDIQVELYTEKKDLDLEERVESLWDDHHLYFDKTEQYLSSERLYQIRYTISLIGG